jgi:hypothetical protein
MQHRWDRLSPVFNRWIPQPRISASLSRRPLRCHSSPVRAVCVNALVRICAGAISNGRPYSDDYVLGRKITSR